MHTHSVPLRSIRKLCETGQLEKALFALDMADQSISIGIFYHLLQACTAKKDVNHARKVHDLIIKHGLDSNAFLETHLIRTFAMCGSLLEANQVFRSLSHPSDYAWLAMISLHTTLGQGTEALNLYFEMQHLHLHLG
eukprot:c6721_g1_i1 orf=189-599(+)